MSFYGEGSMNNDNLELIAFYVFGVMTGVILTVGAFILGVQDLLN